MRRGLLLRRRTTMKGTLKIEDHSAMPEDQVLPEKHGRSSVKGEIVSAGFVTDDY
jgi:hypothetical protein